MAMIINHNRRAALECRDGRLLIIGKGLRVLYWEGDFNRFYEYSALVLGSVVVQKHKKKKNKKKRCAWSTSYSSLLQSPSNQNEMSRLRTKKNKKTFAVRMKNHWVPSYPLSALRRLIRLGHFVGFVMRRLKCNFQMCQTKGFTYTTGNWNQKLMTGMHVRKCFPNFIKTL